MIKLILATVFFVATHAIPAYRPLRQKLIAVLGLKIYLTLFASLSIFAFGWLGSAYFRAPYIEVWEPQYWTAWIPVVIMPFVCFLFFAGLTSKNPLSIGAGSKGYDPEHPGIVSLTRHPLIWALILWAAAHIPPNGDAASLIMFTFLTTQSIFGPAIVDYRMRKKIGEEKWRKLSATTSNLPFRGVIDGRTKLDCKGIGAWRLIGGLALYAVLMAGHEYVIGIAPPLPW